MLVVAGDPDERQQLDHALRRDGVDVTLTSDAAGALVELRRAHHDAAVLALEPGGDRDAFSLLDSLQSDSELQSLPAVLYSPHSRTPEEDERISGFQAAITLREASSPAEAVDAVAPFLRSAHGADDAPAGPARGDDSLIGKHVLIVDDDVRNIFSLTSVLEDAGIKVSFAENGRDALTLLDSTPGIDLVLMDVMMPEMDGYETTHAIRERPPFAAVPVVVLTAKAMKGDREKSLAAGASDYISKPVDPARLLDVVGDWLRR